MADFTAIILRDYRDLPGLVLDCHSGGLIADEGTHTGANNSAVLVDAAVDWTVDSLKGKIVQNITDGSYGTITANTATTVTAALTGGTDDDWDVGDDYSISGDNNGVLEWSNQVPPARVVTDEHDGTHTGLDNQPFSLVDSTKNWRPNGLVGLAVRNVTDGSVGNITSNDATSLVAYPLGGGTDNDWDNGDVYEIRDVRYGNPIQATPSAQPVVRTGSGGLLLEFTRTRTHWMNIPRNPSGFDIPSTWWTAVVECWNGADNTDHQMIYNFGGVLLARRISGNYNVQHGSPLYAGGSELGDGNIFLLRGNSLANQFTLFRGNGTGGLYHQVTTQAATGTPGAYDGHLGGDPGLTWFDGGIKSIRVWKYDVSFAMVNFLMGSLANYHSYSTETWATIESRVWADETGDYSRINSSSETAQLFYVARIPAGSTAAKMMIVGQLAYGGVYPDPWLGAPGKLFHLVALEFPAAPPLIEQEASWSSVFEVTVEHEGHYTFQLYRQEHGSVILHLDVEAE